MRDGILTFIGDFTAGEWTLVILFFAAILGFSWLPRGAGAIGAWFDR